MSAIDLLAIRSEYSSDRKRIPKRYLIIADIEFHSKSKVCVVERASLR